MVMDTYDKIDLMAQSYWKSYASIKIYEMVDQIEECLQILLY